MFNKLSFEELLMVRIAIVAREDSIKHKIELNVNEDEIDIVIKAMFLRNNKKLERRYEYEIKERN